MNLEQLGWNAFHQEHFQAIISGNQYEYTLEPGRVAAVHMTLCRVLTRDGEIEAAVSGKIRDNVPEQSNSAAAVPPDYPAVGDWVAMIHDPLRRTGIIRHIMPRASKFSRKKAGPASEEQVIAANIDTAFLVNALTTDFNINRMERYLVAAWNSGTAPVVVLNKSDLCPDLPAMLGLAREAAIGVPVVAVSAALGTGFDQLREHIPPGRTCVFLGSSGVGKSSIVNRLLGREAIATGETSAYKDKGRHVTSSREMHLLEGGGIVIDTPGLRELQLWAEGDGLSQAFEDIEALAEKCRFADCRHRDEPGCAVKQALGDGSLDGDHYRNYQKLQRELIFQARQQDLRLRLEENRRWKRITKRMRHFDKAARF